MKIEIQDLFDDWEENELRLSVPVDTDAILRRTTEKIGRKPMKKRKLTVLLVAAACLLLSATVVAATHRASIYRNVDSLLLTLRGDTFKSKREEVIVFEPQQEPSRPNMIGFTLSWLPQGARMPEQDLDGVTLGQRLNKIGAECELESTVLEEAKTNVQYVVGDQPNGQVINVDIYSSAAVSGKSFVPWGEMTLEKEGIIEGMEALWITTTMKDTVTKILLLYHGDYNCVVKIGSFRSGAEVDFKELERIAKGLTLVDSGVPSVDESPDMNYHILGVGLG